jgi:arsenate reductase
MQQMMPPAPRDLPADRPLRVTHGRAATQAGTLGELRSAFCSSAPPTAHVLRWPRRSRATSPTVRSRSRALRAIARLGADMRRHVPKHVEALGERFFDRVIILCDAEHETCPTYRGTSKVITWNTPDPARVEGTEEARLRAFNQVAMELTTRIRLRLGPARAREARRCVKPGAASRPESTAASARQSPAGGVLRVSTGARKSWLTVPGRSGAMGLSHLSSGKGCDGRTGPMGMSVKWFEVTGGRELFPTANA